MKRTAARMLLVLMLMVAAVFGGIATADNVSCSTVDQIEAAAGQDVPDDVEMALADIDAQADSAAGQDVPLC